jgi:hypothetical protein
MAARRALNEPVRIEPASTRTLGIGIEFPRAGRRQDFR